MGRTETRVPNETWLIQDWDYFDAYGTPGTWQQLVNDTDNNTFIYGFGSGGLSNGNATFGFGDLLLGSNERCAGARVAWTGGSMGGWNYNMDIWLIPVYSGDGGGRNWNEDTGQAFWDHWNDWWVREFGYTECRDMRVGLRFQMGGAITTPKVSKIWVDYDVRTQPVASGVSPSSGTINTLRPTITWTNNHQGDTARAYQVVITDAAGTWIKDSGRIAGSATSYQFSTDLVQGTSYRAYVRIATDFLSTDYWSDWGGGSLFSTFLNTSTMAATSGMTASASLVAGSNATMAGAGDMTTTPKVIAMAAAIMPSDESDLLATYKKSSCQTCLGSCSCFLAEDGFFSGTSDFQGRNYTQIEGNGSVDDPFVVHFLDADLFRPRTAEISFQNGTITSSTTFNDPRLVTPGNSMNYESPVHFIITDYFPNESMFVQSNYFILGASVTFAEVADAATTFRRIVLSMFVQDPISGVEEITIAGQTVPGGITDPLTLACSGFVPGLFENLSALSTIVSPVNLYISQNSGSPLAISNIKVWVTQI